MRGLVIPLLADDKLMHGIIRKRLESAAKEAGRPRVDPYIVFFNGAIMTLPTSDEKRSGDREQPLNEALRARLPRLLEMGAVESNGGRGKGARYLLVRRLYEALGAKGVYTRKKGLGRETNQALLLQHIQRNAAAGARMA